MISLRSYGYSVHNSDNIAVLKRAVDERGYDAVFKRLNYVISLQGNDDVIKIMKNDLQVLTMMEKSNTPNKQIIPNTPNKKNIMVYKTGIKLSSFGYDTILSNKERYHALKKGIKMVGKNKILNRLIEVLGLTKNNIKKNIFENDIRWLNRAQNYFAIFTSFTVVLAIALIIPKRLRA
jgi:hypothetical protein